MPIRARIKQLTADNRGVAAIEFALALPLLALLLLGGFELSRQIMIHHKAEKSVYTVADIVAQQTSVTSAQLDQIILAASEIMQPYDSSENSRVILSSVYQNGQTGTPTVQWQYVGGGSLQQDSKVGTTGQTAQLPGGLTLNDKDNVIVAEFYYKLDPLFPGFGLDSSVLYKFALFKPRLGLLTTPPS